MQGLQQQVDPCAAVRRQPDTVDRAVLVHLYARRLAGPVDEEIPAREIGPGLWEIEVPKAENALVVVAESWDPDWIATDGSGARRDVLRADGLFASFLAPEQGGTVTLRHAPRSLRMGVLASAAALVVVAVVTVMGRGRRLPHVTARDGASARAVLRFAAPVLATVVVVASWAGT